MRKIIGFLVSVLLILSSIPAHAAEPFDPETIPFTSDQMLVVVSDSQRLDSRTQLSVQPPGVKDGEARGKWINCTTLSDIACATNDPSRDILSWVVLPYCGTDSSEVCISKFSIGLKNSILAPAKYLGIAPNGLIIPEDKSKNFVGGTSPALFESTLENAGGTKTYGVVVKLTQHFDYKANKFIVTDLLAAVSPYKVTQRVGAGNSCLYVDGSLCAQVQDFAPDTRLEIQFRMPKTIAGWFKGRLKDPVVDIQSYSSTLNQITVNAEPVTVPTMALVRNRKDFTVQETTWLNNNGRWGVANGEATGAEGSQGEIFNYIDFYRTLANDRAAGVNTAWKMSSLMGGESSNCFADKSKLYGLVTTNAIGYEGRPPRFKDGMLDYKVTGLHFMPNGTDLFEGTYDLVMRSETARCLYGFTNAPISASISVLGGETQTIATTLVTEKNNWLKLSAYGFTFSSKTLRVKISQKKTTTITCQKGKTVKKVTGSAPVCPAGFKKK